MSKTNIYLLSDLHREFAAQVIDVPSEADVIIMAGDIDIGFAGIDYAGTLVKPVIYVLGNHEYYGGDITATLESCRERAALYGNVHLLENQSIVINNVRYHGCTLWTDYELNKARHYSTVLAEVSLNDHKCISDGDSVFSAERARVIHKHSREWLYKSIAESTESKNVVITHHLPMPELMHLRYINGSLSPAFASHCLEFVELADRIDLWAFGHNHYSVEKELHGIRFVSNQLGYPNEPCGFQEDKIIKI